jgi:hypothetical protein
MAILHGINMERCSLLLLPKYEEKLYCSESLTYQGDLSRFKVSDILRRMTFPAFHFRHIQGVNPVWSKWCLLYIVLLLPLLILAAMK